MAGDGVFMLQKEDVKKLEKKIGYEFQDESLLWQALTHSSFSNEQKVNKSENYERLEFLGDAVLELISSEFFFSNYTDWKEGQLTRVRSSMVCEPALAFCAREIGIQNYIRLGRGEEATGGRERDSIISDVMESVLGAIYLDGGLEHAQKFVYDHILSDLEKKQLFYDSKSILQERVQKAGKELTYHLVSESGPDHDKVFVIEALIDGKVVGTGTGRNKKAAEQQAAYQVIKEKK